MNRFVSGQDDVLSTLAPREHRQRARAPPVRSTEAVSRSSLRNGPRHCLLCGVEVAVGQDRATLTGRWTQTCCGCGPACIDGEGPTMIRTFMAKVSKVEDRYSVGSLHVCRECFFAEDRMARRRREVHLSCACVFDVRSVECDRFA